MKPKSVFLMTVLALITLIIVFFVKGWAYFSYGRIVMDGPGLILEILPYQTEDKKIVFTQWINNDEIAYLEFVMRSNDYSQRRCPLFMYGPVADINIYREKVNQPETKKLIKHIVIGNVAPGLFHGDKLDENLGFKVYDDGKKIFLYYTYDSVLFIDHCYITMNANGSYAKKGKISMLPFDISRDGKWIFGIEEEKAPWVMYKKVMPDGKITNILDDHGESKYYVAKYSINSRAISRIVQINDDIFKQSRQGNIRDLKLVADDKLVLSYDKNASAPGIGMYTYLIDVSTGKSEFVEDLWDAFEKNRSKSNIYGDVTAIFSPDRMYAMTKNKKYLISGNIGIYEKQNDRWVKIKDFFKRNPCISPDGKRILYYDTLTKKIHREYVSYAGEELIISDINKIFEDQK